ncbi:DUF3566 domain-containing protein [Nakamurella silvestris]|nr:DUF3566 domain-containing protein [Nakamurella silvestris]
MTRPNPGAPPGSRTTAPAPGNPGTATPNGPAVTPPGAPAVAPATGSPRRGRDKSAKADKSVREGAAAPRKVRAAKKPPRVTSLQLKRIDPWTVLKISLIVSIVMFFVWMIAVGLLYLLFGSMDVFSTINDAFANLFVSDKPDAPTGALITPARVFGIAAIIGAINIVLFTALSAIGAFIYNAAAGMAGGVEVTLGERD